MGPRRIVIRANRYGPVCTAERRQIYRKNPFWQNNLLCGVRVARRAVEEPKTRGGDSAPGRIYRGALFPGVEVPEAGADVWRGISRVFPWGNGAPVTENVGEEGDGGSGLDADSLLPPPSATDSGEQGSDDAPLVPRAD